MSITLMMSAAVVSSLRALRIRPVGASWVSVGSPATSGMTTTPVSNPDRPSARAGKTKQRGTGDPEGRRVRTRHRIDPVRDQRGVRRDMEQSVDDDDGGQPEVDDDEDHGDADGPFEALEEDRREQAQEDQRERHLAPLEDRLEEGFSMRWALASAADSVMVMMKPVATNPMRDRTSSFARPVRQQPLEHREAAVTMRRLLGDPSVHR